MKWVKQKTEADCLPCAISMASGVPYEQLRKAFKDNTNFSISRKRGANHAGIEKTLKFLGIKFEPIRYGDFHSVAYLMNSNRGILVYKVKGNNSGHAVAWDGFKIYDPCTSIDKSYTFKEFNQIRKSIECWNYGLTFKTPLIVRILSFINGEVQSYELNPKFCEWIKNYAYKLSRWLHLSHYRRSSSLPRESGFKD